MESTELEIKEEQVDIDDLVLTSNFYENTEAIPEFEESLIETEQANSEFIGVEIIPDCDKKSPLEIEPLDTLRWPIADYVCSTVKKSLEIQVQYFDVSGLGGWLEDGRP